MDGAFPPGVLVKSKMKEAATITTVIEDNIATSSKADDGKTEKHTGATSSTVSAKVEDSIAVSGKVSDSPYQNAVFGKVDDPTASLPMTTTPPLLYPTRSPCHRPPLRMASPRGGNFPVGPWDPPGA
uniref:Uncharacterized protein n=1 Tax=Oryza nivara TaxID=4536 RepID=A0A0E0J505_ORYNI